MDLSEYTPARAKARLNSSQSSTWITKTKYVPIDGEIAKVVDKLHKLEDNLSSLQRKVYGLNTDEYVPDPVSISEQAESPLCSGVDPFSDKSKEEVAPPGKETAEKAVVSAEDILDKAIEILAQRAKGRDVKKERSLPRAVAIFNAVTGIGLTEAQGAVFMVCLKLARAHGAIAETGPYNDDDVLDGINYLALMGESLGNKT